MTQRTELVDVRMIDLRAEKDLGWHHRVVLGQEEFCFKHASFVDGLGRAGNLDKEVAAVAL